MREPAEREVDVASIEVDPAVLAATEALARAVYGESASLEVGLIASGYYCTIQRTRGGTAMATRTGHTPRQALACALSDIASDERVAAYVAEARERQRR